MSLPAAEDNFRVAAAPAPPSPVPVVKSALASTTLPSLIRLDFLFALFRHFGISLPSHRQSVLDAVDTKHQRNVQFGRQAADHSC